MAKTEASRRWAGVSRTQQRIQNNLGIIDGNKTGARKFRDNKLEKFDAYYENRQYDNLIDWDEALEQSAQYSDSYTPVRKRKPRIIYPVGQILVDRVAAKLIGDSVFPKLMVEEDPDTTELVRVVMQMSSFQHYLREPVKRMLAAGSSLLRFHLVDGVVKFETYSSKYCYPTFQGNGELEQVTIKYIYEDQGDRDSQGNPKKKWFRLDLAMDADTLYEPAPAEGEAEPEWTVQEQISHGLGIVQAEWFRTSEDNHCPDGHSLMDGLESLIDDLCYGISQSSQAVGYNQDPQLTVKGIDEDEVDTLVRSSQKAWNLGREGEAAFLETNLTGVEAANTFRDRIFQKALNVARVVILDPEKIVGSAQSGKAMEMLHGPMLELIDELRPGIEKSIISLLTKIIVSLLYLNAQGFETALIVPPGYNPASLAITASWPPVFPPTIEDIQKRVQAAAQARTANLISPETALRFVAKDFGVENIEEELAKIDAAMQAQAALNPYGAF